MYADPFDTDLDALAQAFDRKCAQNVGYAIRRDDVDNESGGLRPRFAADLSIPATAFQVRLRA